MVRQGQPRAGQAIADLDPAILKELEAWADSDKRHTATSIYRRFNLVERGISIRSFQRWVAKRRKSLLAQGAAARRRDADDRSGPEDMVLNLLMERAEAGDPKHLSSIASALRALCDFRRLGFDQAAERRAQEIHEEKMEDVRKRKVKADAEVDRISVEHGIPDVVRDAVKSLYGISLDPDTAEGAGDQPSGGA